MGNFAFSNAVNNADKRQMQSCIQVYTQKFNFAYYYLIL